jgi:hypothetical protein
MMPCTHISPTAEVRRAARTRWFQRRRQATNLIAAFEFAEAMGLPLNVSVDIAWIFFSENTEDRTRLARCQQRLSKWACRHGFPLTMIWTREIGKYGSPHTHVLLHVPPIYIHDGTFQHALERSLEPEGGPIHDKAILIQPAYRPLESSSTISKASFLGTLRSSVSGQHTKGFCLESGQASPRTSDQELGERLLLEK